MERSSRGGIGVGADAGVDEWKGVPGGGVGAGRKELMQGLMSGK